jgi:hypothetical protein
VQQFRHDLLVQSGPRRGRTIAAGTASRARRRCTVARSTTGAARAAAIIPPAGVRAATASVKSPPLGSIRGLAVAGRQRDARQLRSFFLNPDGRLGPRQAQRQTGSVALCQRHFAGERVGLGSFRTTPGWRRRVECSGVALTARTGRRRRADALAAQDGADPTARSGATGRGKDPQFVPGGASPPARAIRQST